MLPMTTSGKTLVGCQLPVSAKLPASIQLTCVGVSEEETDTPLLPVKLCENVKATLEAP